jgi:Ca2+/H+ antiporter, TMEM165/GDT1 family
MIWMAPAAILGMLIFSAIGGGVVKLLWNWLLPQLFGWSEITFWQALGLLALCRILFGGFGLHRPCRSNSRRRMQERCEHMTPEERERFRQGIRERWGSDPSTGESKWQ